jgi:hypothetical protein
MGHPRCPSDLLERFFDAAVYSAASAVPAHPHLALSRLAAFLASRDAHVRVAAARNPQLTAAQFERAAQDDDTCEAMALNVALPTAWFERLLHDPRVGVRENLARNRSLPEPLMAELAVDPARSVRRTLLRHPELTDEARAKVRV